MTSAPPEGLRARKRRATYSGIQLAALRLALDEGLDAVTVDRICAIADVSRSTFFNYFPSRDAAIGGLPIIVPTGDEAFAVLDEHAPDTVRGALALFFHAMGDTNLNSEVLRLRHELSAHQPEVRRMETARVVESGASAMPVVADWLRAHPEHARLDGDPDREARLIVNSVYIAVDAMDSIWRAATGEVEASFTEFDEVMTDLRAIFGA